MQANEDIEFHVREEGTLIIEPVTGETCTVETGKAILLGNKMYLTKEDYEAIKFHAITIKRKS